MDHATRGLCLFGSRSNSLRQDVSVWLIEVREKRRKEGKVGMGSSWKVRVGAQHFKWGTLGTAALKAEGERSLGNWQLIKVYQPYPRPCQWLLACTPDTGFIGGKADDW